MTYDNIDSNSDGVIEADVDNESVDTDNINNIYWVQSVAQAETVLSEATDGDTIQFYPDIYEVDRLLNVKKNVTLDGTWSFFDAASSDQDMFQISGRGGKVLRVIPRANNKNADLSEYNISVNQLSQ